MTPQKSVIFSGFLSFLGTFQGRLHDLFVFVVMLGCGGLQERARPHFSGAKLHVGRVFHIGADVDAISFFAWCCTIIGVNFSFVLSFWSFISSILSNMRLFSCQSVGDANKLDENYQSLCETCDERKGTATYYKFSRLLLNKRKHGRKTENISVQKGLTIWIFMVQ